MRRDGRGHVLAVLGIGITLVAAACRAEPVFPLLRELAGDEDLPAPFGLTATVYWQKQSYGLSDLTVIPLDDTARDTLHNFLRPSERTKAVRAVLPALPDPGDIVIPGLPGSLVAPFLLDTIDIDNRVSEINLQADLWVLPFLNVFALAGQIDGRTRVDLTRILGTKMLIEYDGFVYGFGAVASYAVDRVFACLNATVTQTELDTSSSTVGAWLILPQVGVRIPWGAVWLGAMYQRADETHDGMVGDGQRGRLYYDVSLEDEEPWNCIGGARLDLPHDWCVDAQIGLGDRQSVQASVSRRF